MLENAIIWASIFHLRAIYWAIVKHWRRRNFESKETIEKFLPHFHFLESASLYPCWLNHLCSSLKISIVFVSFNLHGGLKWWRPGWKNLVSQFQWVTDRGCHFVLLFWINRNTLFSSNFMCKCVHLFPWVYLLHKC